MKKRALISATAVMLVALMCLATASYAWFTASGDATIEAFDVKVSGADAAVELSADGQAFGPKLTKANIETYGSGNDVFPTSLGAVSTADCETFFATRYDNAKWYAADKDGNAISADGQYIVFDFWARAPKAGTADLGINFDLSALDPDLAEGEEAIETNAFTGAVKVGVKYDGQTNFTIYDLATDSGETYYPMIAKGAICEKVNGEFVPADDTESSYSTEARGGNVLPSLIEDVPVAGGNSGTHYTVVVWVEGMDKNCSGNFNAMAAVKLGLNFTNFVETAA